ncbi:molybdenum cofactor guanylyltransferase [Candidatus Hecatella orcuttiae]|jgi:molybdopterin-guanine dinucleotide biosynthesis protein A|uniref:molybdenum cofactor guanylyltransferase n=1 Tax=Candidatus Hecatella orcuttiae TaxID=1935119 RepID=UPI002867FE6E|nr:molybdenum cofactor guanylyltransferase [Candidatus Hecatella orcuttiae]
MRGRGVVVLAGGGSVRMGGVNKAFLSLQGKPLLRWVVEGALGAAGKVVVVLSKSSPEGPYRRILPATVSLGRDAVEGGGPIAGLAAGIRSLKVEYVAVLPCDVPFVNPQVLGLLFQEAEGRASEAVIPRWPNGYREPLHAVYRSQPTLPAAEEALAQGEYSMLDVVKRLEHVYYLPVDQIRNFDPQLRGFFNINTPQDLEKAACLLKKG